MCSNIAECFNSWIAAERYMPVTSMVDKIHIKIMDMMFKHREKCRGWSSKLCPKMEKVLAQNITVGQTWKVTKSSDFVFEVHYERSHCVDLRFFRCSCGRWLNQGFPCAHALQCILRIGEDVYKFCDSYFLVNAFHELYSHAIVLILDYEKPLEVNKGAHISPLKLGEL
ncbi:hypothetical protein IFM89_011305 [Coptis chinensis]|uniref:SWIM-type domain-containing protein n=1 Tax=Coptis chinensis TaxID=261450 RepID=A0A835HV84_9MAGN|nr:hypothetical protein IFM89_011305 [Coptis chinensis]